VGPAIIPRVARPPHDGTSLKDWPPTIEGSLDIRDTTAAFAATTS
jgi:hypothetical protein